MTAASPFRNCLISIVSTELDTLRSYWKQGGADSDRPLAERTAAGKPIHQLGGAICKIDRDGDLTVAKTWMPASMAPDGRDVLVTSPWAVSRRSPDLSLIDDLAIDSGLLNAVHWISPSRHGWLLASSGLDLIFEIQADGDITWEWWATEHGFVHDPRGRRRHVTRDKDHRGIDYGTLAQTTHVNSVAELGSDYVLATLFHQGTVIRIQRSTGDWNVILGDLIHPHAVRQMPDGRFSVVDTGRGRVLIIDPSGGREPEMVIAADTDWLQDAAFDPADRRWLLVDGRHSRLLGYSLDDALRPVGGPAILDLDPNWRPYGVLVLSDEGDK